MALKATITEPLDAADRRRSRRRTLSLSAPRSLSCSSEAPALVLEISAGGFLLHTQADELSIGDSLFIHLPRNGPTKAEIVWTSGSYFGCRFENEICEEVIDAALLQAKLDASGAALAEQAQDRDVSGAQKNIEKLSRREFDVLRGLLAGLQNKEIAQELGISPRTVEIHRAKLMNKLGERLPGLIRIAMLAGVQPLVQGEVRAGRKLDLPMRANNASAVEARATS